MMTGCCNICGKFGKLTRDHVPPKGSADLRDVNIQSYTDMILGAKSATVNPSDPNALVADFSHRRVSQNGLKFRTICADCNNNLLGSRYDPEIIRVSEAVRTFVRPYADCGIIPPETVRVSVRTHYLLRGIIGHLLAAIEFPNRNKPYDTFGKSVYDSLRRYVLDESLPLPSCVTVYYWTYPYKDQLVIKSLCVCEQRKGECVIGDLLKFFPLAYFIAFEGELKLLAPTIVGHGCSDMNCSVDLSINFGKIPPMGWPEKPGPEHCVIVPAGASSIVALRTPPPSVSPGRRRNSGFS